MSIGRRVNRSTSLDAGLHERAGSRGVSRNGHSRRKEGQSFSLESDFNHMTYAPNSLMNIVGVETWDECSPRDNGSLSRAFSL